jgi:hypothetical protein
MKRRKIIGCLLLSLLGATAMAVAGAPTPARVQLDGFLAAFNSGDRTTVIAFGKDHAPPDFLRPAIVDQTLEMYRASGGYDVLEVTETDPLSVTSWVRARKTQEIVRLAVQVHANEPERISAIGFVSDVPPEHLRARK